MIRSLDDLSRSLGYRFQDVALLQEAVTHRSAGSRNNERLEFLGDAVLGYVIAEALYMQFPAAREGQLSRLRASLVKRETLAAIARDLALGDYLSLGSGELKSGGFRRESILADALEAIFGAIVLDAGFTTCHDTIRRLFAARLGGLSADDEQKDPKTRLQEHLQSRKLELPVYSVQEVTGKAHNQQFIIECRVEDMQCSSQGRGSNRRRAEQAAAEAMLAQLETESGDG
ncbi:MAG TPA: ribonuclease III [Gammaproteobacteria bacterium]|nr:ribonuclease III [Gammaproteobacteria bacterium]